MTDAIDFLGHTPMRRQSLLVFVVLLMFTVAAPAHGQSELSNADAANNKGLLKQRGYFSPEPFEHFDTLSGNLVLTFTDLVLPGNAGRELRFQRTYNNQSYQSGAFAGDGEAPSRWVFGFPGMVMRVSEKPVPSDADFSQFQRIITTTPWFIMGDGSWRRTIYLNPPTGPTLARVATVESGDFYRYNRQDHTLQMPDGTFCTYDPTTGRLTSFRDPFGNMVYLEWNTTGVAVTQVLGNGQSRLVVLTFDDAGRVTQMNYEDRQWTYEYGYAYQGKKDITRALFPAGLNWTFTYDDAPQNPGLAYEFNGMTSVTTPNGGVIGYEYAERELFSPPPDTIREVRRSLSARTVVGPPGTTSGRWEITLDANGSGQYLREYSLQTEILTPSAKVKYEHTDTSTPTLSDHILEGGLGLRTQTIYPLTSGQPIETTTYSYQELPVNTSTLVAVSAYVPTISKRDIVRSGHTYTAEYTYGNTNFADYHHPNRLTETRDGTTTRTTTFAYDHVIPLWILGNLATEITTVGNQSIARNWDYDQYRGYRTCETAPYIYTTGTYTCTTAPGIRTIFSADSLGNLRLVSKANNHWIKYTYEWGQVSGIETLQHTITRIINRDGSIDSETQAERTTTFSYDAIGRVKEKQPPGGTNPIITEYDQAGAWIRTSRGASQTTMTLDGFGRVIDTTIPATAIAAGVRTHREYDAEGRLIRDGLPVNVGDPDQYVTIEYDSLGRVTRRVNPGGSESRLSYDVVTGGGLTVAITDENNHVTTQGWLPFGDPDDARLVNVTDAKSQSWDYFYNVAGQLTSVRAPDGLMRSWTYDNKGLLQNETHPESGTTIYNLYDAAGVLLTKTDANGTQFQYTYDGNDRLRQISADGGTEVTAITYEPGSDNRQLTQVTIAGVTQSSEFLWDRAGRLAGRTDTFDGQQFDTRYEHDADDNVVAIFYPGVSSTIRRRVEFSYDAANRLQGIRDLLNDRDYASGFSYHPSGALERYTSGNGIVNSFGYDPQRYWIRSVAAAGWTLQYENYDAVGNVGGLVDSRPEVGIQTFAYDQLDRLVTATGPYGLISYAYDAHGNRTNANGTTYEYWPGTLRLKSQSGAQYTYDSNGNMKTGPSALFDYTPGNMLKLATVSGATTTYGYDADQLRVKKTAQDGTVSYYFRGPQGELLTEWKNPAGVGTIRDYVYAGSRLVATIGRPLFENGSLNGSIVPGGGSVAVTIASGQNAALTFNGVAGQQISVVLWRMPSGNFEGTWDVRVLRPDGTELASTYNGQAPWIFLDVQTLPVSGTYTLVIDPRQDASGSVSATIYNVVHDTRSVFADGEPHNVVLATPGQNGFLTFSASAGQQVSVLVQSTSAEGFEGTWDTRLLRPDGTQQAVVTTSGTTTSYGPLAYGFMDVQVLPASGTYTVAVDPRVMSSGTVTVKIFTVTHETPSISADGAPVSVRITTPGQNGRLPFNGVEGQLVSATMTWLSAGGFDGTWDLRILKPDGTELTSSAIYTPYTVGFVDAMALPTSGTYTLAIDPRGPVMGPVDARLYTFVNVTTPIASDGTPVSVPIAKPGQNGRLPFSGVQGQLVSASMTWTSAGAFDGTWDLIILKPDGTQLTSGTIYAPYTVGFVDTIALPSTGTYTLLINPRSMATGTVDARLYNVAHVTTPIVANGAAVPVTVDTPGQSGRLPFTASAGQVITATVSAVSPSTFAGTWDITILRPDGSALTSQAAYSPLTVVSLANRTLPDQGTYTLVIDPRAMDLGSVSARITSP